MSAWRRQCQWRLAGNGSVGVSALRIEIFGAQLWRRLAVMWRNAMAIKEISYGENGGSWQYQRLENIAWPASKAWQLMALAGWPKCRKPLSAANVEISMAGSVAWRVLKRGGIGVAGTAMYLAASWPATA